MCSPYWLFTYPLVWAIVLSIPVVMRRQECGVKQYSSHTFIFMPTRGNREVREDLNMKWLFTAFLMLLNILPIFAAPRDDRDSGTSGISFIIMIIILIIGTVKACKGDDK